MYGWVWQHLPGPVPVRLLISLVLIAGIVVSLFLWVFPWVESHLEYDNTQVPRSQQSSPEAS